MGNDLEKLLQPPEFRQRLALGAHSLKDLSIRFGSYYSQMHNATEILGHLLEPFLEANQVQRFALSGCANVDAVKLLLSSPPRWPAMTRLYLSRVVIDKAALCSFLDQRDASELHLELHIVKIKNGSWADFLDELRERAFASILITMPRQAHQRALCERPLPGSMNSLERYVLGEDDHNPLR
jgi:hypothetical protein